MRSRGACNAREMRAGARQSPGLNRRATYQRRARHQRHRSEDHARHAAEGAAQVAQRIPGWERLHGGGAHALVALVGRHGARRRLGMLQPASGEAAGVLCDVLRGVVTGRVAQRGP
jgi:hypothetical protein